ncbi:MAG TPA: DUF421 domain-containing protein [Symbiobacteriaceae bacterium]|nr:DUF421 domain-containing protein [Symbiobacteriaceae bacterium]
MGEATIVAVRAVVTFVSLLIFTRLLGKTQIAQLTYFEWVTGITIGSIGGVLTTDLSIRPWPVFVGLAVWVALVMLTQYIALKSRWTGKMLDGEPVVVVHNGQILEKSLAQVRMRVGELNSLLREKNVFDISTVEAALLEPHGKLSVLLRSQERPVTPKDLKIPTAYEGLGVELVVDGEVMEQNLRRMGLNRAWLLDRLREEGVSGPGEAFLAIIDTQGRIYVDRYEDRLPPADRVGDYPGPN